MAAAKEQSVVMETIANLERELNRLKAAIGIEGALPSAGGKVKGTRKPRSPDAKPNAWIDFLKRVHALLKEAKHDGPATIGVMFAKHLKETGGYDWEDSAMLEAFEAWATPERLEAVKAATAKKPKSAASSVAGDAASVTSDKPEKPKRVISDAQKAAMKAGREAAKAKREAEKAAAAAPAEAPAAPLVKDARTGAFLPAEAPKPAAAAPKASSAAAAKPVIKPKAAAKPAFTPEELSNFDEFEHEGVVYGKNKRGDVVDSEGEFAGHWTGSDIDASAPKPADWEAIISA